MNKETLHFVTEETHKLINAPTCSAETKEAAQAWLASIGTEAETLETQNYIKELEADIMPIDQLIAFAVSDAGTQVFGTNASNVADHAKEIKAAGAKYCDCPACATVEAILSRKAELLQ